MNSPPFTFLLSLISNAYVHAARLPTGAGTAFTTSSQGNLFRRQGVEACSPQTAVFSLPHLLEPTLWPEMGNPGEPALKYPMLSLLSPLMKLSGL